MVSLGFTADQDNGQLDPVLVSAAHSAINVPLFWKNAEPIHQVLFKSFSELRGKADRVIAVAHGECESYWVLQNDWSGFPDPAEFVLVGFCDQGEISALGYFEDWPSAWSHPEAN